MRIVPALGLLVAALISLSARAMETNITGKIDLIYMSSSTLSDFRISVHLAPTNGTFSTACVAGWYSAERENLQLKKGWLTTALLARATQSTVTIIGKGTCDDYGIESLSTIEY